MMDSFISYFIPNPIYIYVVYVSFLESPDSSVFDYHKNVSFIENINKSLVTLQFRKEFFIQLEIKKFKRILVIEKLKKIS